MIIVGIHNTGTTSSACVVQDGVPLFAAAEERFTRDKHDKYFPYESIGHGLASIGATLSDVDCFSIAWNPAINLSGRFRAGQSEWPSHPGERLYSNLNHVLPKLDRRPQGGTEQLVAMGDGAALRFDYVDHHQAHAALSFLTSPFEDAAILIVDG